MCRSRMERQGSVMFRSLQAQEILSMFSSLL
jgi:hypothetical protein